METSMCRNRVAPKPHLFMTIQVSELRGTMLGLWDTKRRLAWHESSTGATLHALDEGSEIVVVFDYRKCQMID